MKFDLIYPLRCPSRAPRVQFSYPSTIPEHIGPMIIYTKFDQMKIIGGVFLLVKC